MTFSFLGYILVTLYMAKGDYLIRVFSNHMSLISRVFWVVEEEEVREISSVREIQHDAGSLLLRWKGHKAGPLEGRS